MCYKAIIEVMIFVSRTSQTVHWAKNDVKSGIVTTPCRLEPDSCLIQLYDSFTPAWFWFCTNWAPKYYNESLRLIFILYNQKKFQTASLSFQKPLLTKTIIRKLKTFLHFNKTLTVTKIKSMDEIMLIFIHKV